MAPATEAETNAEAEERKAHYEQQRKEYEAEQEAEQIRRTEERKQEFDRQQKEHEAEQAKREKLHKTRTATFNRIVDNAPITFNAAQLRVFLRALVNLDPYTLADDIAEHFATDDENHQQTAEEILLSAIDSLNDHMLTGFALRLALTGHTGIPRENEFDFLSEAVAVLIPPPSKADAEELGAKALTSVKPSPKNPPVKKKAAA